MEDTNRIGLVYASPMNTKKSTKRWTKMLEYITKKEIDFDYVHSEGIGSTGRLTKMLIKNGYKTIGIIGGDSSLNEAVNIIMNLPQQTRETIKLAIIPNGQSNDFANFWKLSYDNYEQAIDVLERHRLRKIDVAKCHFEETGENLFFVNCVNIGFVASIINLRSKMNKIHHFRFTKWLASSILITTKRRLYKMKLQVNDESINSKLMNVCIGNALGYGQTPSSVPYNGMLDVSAIHNMNLKQLMQGGILMWMGKILNLRHITPYRTKQISVIQTSRASINIDGRKHEKTEKPINISIEKECLNFIIP